MVRIQGLVVPIDWDDDGNVTSVAIATRAEEEFLIRDSDKVEELKRLLRQEVEVRGEMTLEGSQKVILVKSVVPQPRPGKDSGHSPGVLI
jgi:hypothetical protein